MSFGKGSYGIESKFKRGAHHPYWYGKILGKFSFVLVKHFNSGIGKLFKGGYGKLCGGG